jgi:hypothetical protein
MITEKQYLEAIEIVKKYNKQQNEYIFKFGKYKGETLLNVRKNNPSYLAWMWLNIREKLDATLFSYIERNFKDIKKEASNEHANYLYNLCGGEVCVEY